MPQNSCALLTVVLAVTLSVPAAAAAQDSAERLRLDELARQAAQRFAEVRASGGTEVPDALQTRTTNQPPAGVRTELSLDDAVQRALERNLDIAVERLDPEGIQHSIEALQASYRPTVTSNFGLRNQTAFARSQTAGGSVLETETLTGNTGLTQNLKWGGGSFAAAFNNNRQEQSDAFAIRNPAISTNLNFSYVQPLLRSFRIDGTRAAIQITRINHSISETALRATIIRTLANVRNAYWDLVYTIQAAEVAENSLTLATKLVEDNRARVEVGTLAPLDVVQAQAEEANRRGTVAQTAAAVRTAELVLKRLIVNGTDDPLWTARVEPVDRPTYSTDKVDVEGAVRRALSTRTDLDTARKQLDSNAVSLRTLADAKLPGLDLSASYGMAGIGGTQFERSGLGGAISRTIPSGYSDALRILGARDAPTWNMGVTFSYPLGHSAAEAGLARARVQQRQTTAQLRQIELQVATEVTNAALQVEATRERLQAALAARELAERRLEAEQSRFEVGLSTNFFVVQGQRDLRDAQNAELRSLLDYRRSQVEFERVQEVPGSGNIGITSIQPGGGTAPRANAGGGTGFGGN
jgi:outer membrane protein